MSFSIRDALAGGGLLLTIGTAVAAFIIGNFSGEQVKPAETISDVASPASSDCPAGWLSTIGDDPHAGRYVACESPDGRYIMRISDGTKTTLDQESGEFVDSGQFR
jgi:hypothetical protein